MTARSRSVGDEVQELLSEFPSAVKRIKDAAEESLAVAKNARSHVRRERIVSRSQPGIPRIKTQEPELEMPDAWRAGEDTKKIRAV